MIKSLFYGTVVTDLLPLMVWPPSQLDPIVIGPESVASHLSLSFVWGKEVLFVSPLQV